MSGVEWWISTILILLIIVYSVKRPTLKISLLVLGCVAYWAWLDVLLPWLNGFLIVNSWAVGTKFCIFVGAFSLFNLIPPSRGGATPVLVLLVALGSTLLVSASNYISLYLAIELPTFSLFILVSQKGGSGLSAEAGLKYFVLGALASGLMLFGCGLLWGLLGGPGFPGEELGGGYGGGGLFITAALLFKLSAAPFHMWAPDVFEGSPAPTTALLSTVPKMGVFSILVAQGPVAQALLVAVLFSLVVGAAGALNQIKIKRLLAYSGIVHMGFVLWGIEMGTLASVQASLIYMVLYLIMAVCAFAIVVVWGGKNLIVEFGGLSRKEPLLAITLGLAFFSIAGVPPLLGFLGKWCVLLAGISYGYNLVSILAVVCSVVAGVYYVRLVKIVFFQTHFFWGVGLKALRVPKTINLGRALLIGACFYLLGLGIICPNLLLQFAHGAATGLF